jgi:putative transposase
VCFAVEARPNACCKPKSGGRKSVTVLLAHQIAVEPNDKQATYVVTPCGVAQFAYNWALAERRNEYEAGGRPSDAALRRLKREKARTIPLYVRSDNMFEVTKCAAQGVDHRSW